MPELSADLNKLAEYHYKRKARQHRKLRKKVMHGMGLSDDTEGDANWAMPEMEQFLQSNQLPVSSDDMLDFMYPWQDSSDDENSIVGTFSSMGISSTSGRKSPRYKPKIKEPKVPYPHMTKTPILVKPFTSLVQERLIN
ncbi:hypothetical protein K7432_015829 [Basidiobolus ranarum]|uniref:Uncharacterized protein n=1 Tax=Basidiobolus ranarum TaxID=34480 RepID=A0ABR2WFM6_9FUNG